MTVQPELSIIVAASAIDNGIGKGGQLPWRLPSDMAYFQRLTLYLNRTSATRGIIPPYADTQPQDHLHQNVVIMGRKTWESIPSKFRPLKDRFNIVLSRDAAFASRVSHQVTVSSSLDEALHIIAQNPALNPKGIWIIGGSAVYQEALEHPACRNVFITRVSSLDNKPMECDVYFPLIQQDPHYALACPEAIQQLLGPHCPTELQENGYTLQFQLYKRII